MGLKAFEPFTRAGLVFKQTTDTDIDMDVSATEDTITVDYLVETTAEHDGFWEGVLEVFVPGSGTAAAEIEVTGFVDAFDDPPFTSGTETVDVDSLGLSETTEVEVVLTWFDQTFVSASDTVEVPVDGNGDNGDDPVDPDPVIQNMSIDCNLPQTTVGVGDLFAVEYTVSNANNVDTNTTVELRDGGSVLDTTTLIVPEDGSAGGSFTLQSDEPGEIVPEVEVTNVE